ncbi:MAG: hypothetical protein JW772_05355, partial [Candidatus Diapherotrites archaeon]|nr:hypothetical protein [Candidatus Diapherotrites archaeon]
MRKALIVLALVLCAGFAQAQAYEITSHTIEMTIDNEGFARITEKFFLAFPNEFLLEDFLKKNEDFGISLDSWKQFDERIHTYIGREEELLRAEVVFVDDIDKYLEIEYSLNTPIVVKKNETNRIIDFAIAPRFFDQFLQGGVYIIPNNTEIAINLPTAAEILSQVRPDGVVSSN